MSTWEQFEIDCTNFLNEQCGEYAKFTHQGRSDSTVPDIKVETKKNKQFYIDVKHSPAQCGQFVLKADEITKTFSFSKRNKSEVNEYVKQIINYMNDHFTAFVNAGTSGEDINIADCENLFANWIIDKYKNMGVQYIITNNFVILPLEKILEFFKIKGKFRVKKSGSSEPAKKYYDDILKILNDNYSISNYTLEKVVSNSKAKIKMFVQTEQNLSNKQFMIGNYVYEFRPVNNCDNKYELRKLSNTFNANVIFSIEIKTNKEGISIADFIFVLVN